MNNENNCLVKVLEVIKVLQNSASKIECFENTCTRPFLGGNGSLICFNTRPVMLYKCDNTPVTINYINSSGIESSTSIFRIQSVSNDAIGVLLLEENTDPTVTDEYLNTNTYATINLDCICCVRCLGDTVVANV